jgi:hypothetical protein
MNTYWSRLVAPVFGRSPHNPPLDRAVLRAAALELRARGLQPRDIAAALKLSEFAVCQLLNLPEVPTNG